MNQQPLLLHSCRAAAGRISFILLIFLSTGVTSQPAAVGPRIEQILSAESIRPAFWGIYVQDLASGDVLFSQNPNHLFIPASNQKILTSAAALDALGSDYRYRTVLYFDGAVTGSTLRGDLVIRGSGDPSFGSVFGGGPNPLRAWAKSLAEMGVTRVEGRIVGDDDVFDDRAYGEGWDIDYVVTQSSRLLGVSAGGLSSNDNVVEVKIVAAGAGNAPEITMRPPGFLAVENGLMTANRRRGISVSTARSLGGESISLQGSIPRSYEGTIVMPVTNPTAFTVNSFRSYLQDLGVDVDADAVDIDDLAEFEYSTEMPLFVHVSRPLAEILQTVNKESNNFYADQVFRSFSGGGSAAGGEQRIKGLLQRAGASTDGLDFNDGSGLSRKNLVSPEAMTKLLAYMYKHPEREAFLGSLAQGGERQSTLQHRLHNLPVRAKTGSLEYVRALSGYASTPDGRTLAFSIFANHFSGPSYQVTQTIDRIVMELASAGQGS
ncbi:MAG: D-alanyl-D-alanine carboxypeptidase/D-alanyl-D-alanine-endopeptidase [Rhodothermales bacterium]